MKPEHWIPNLVLLRSKTYHLLFLLLRSYWFGRLQVLAAVEDPKVYLLYIHPLVNTDLSNQQLFTQNNWNIGLETSVCFEDLGNTCFILKQGQEGLIRYKTLSQYKSGVISNPGYYRLKSSSGSGARGSNNLQRIETNKAPCG